MQENCTFPYDWVDQKKHEKDQMSKLQQDEQGSIPIYTLLKKVEMEILANRIDQNLFWKK